MSSGPGFDGLPLTERVFLEVGCVLAEEWEERPNEAVALSEVATALKATKLDVADRVRTLAREGLLWSCPGRESERVGDWRVGLTQRGVRVARLELRKLVGPIRLRLNRTPEGFLFGRLQWAKGTSARVKDVAPRGGIRRHLLVILWAGSDRSWCIDELQECLSRGAAIGMCPGGGKHSAGGVVTPKSVRVASKALAAVVPWISTTKEEGLLRVNVKEAGEIEFEDREGQACPSENVREFVKERIAFDLLSRPSAPARRRRESADNLS